MVDGLEPEFSLNGEEGARWVNLHRGNSSSSNTARVSSWYSQTIDFSVMKELLQGIVEKQPRQSRIARSGHDIPTGRPPTVNGTAS